LQGPRGAGTRRAWRKEITMRVSFRSRPLVRFAEVAVAGLCAFGCSSSSLAGSSQITDAGPSIDATPIDAGSSQITDARPSIDATPVDAGSSDVVAPLGDSGASGAAQTSIGPIDLPAGVEKTVCIVKDLGNTDDLVITGFVSTLAPGSHHLIVYKTTQPENLTPTPCVPFQGLSQGGAQPILIANKLSVSWTFPAGIALELPAHQMVRIEAHYINASTSDIQGMGTVVFQGTPASSAPAFQPAEFLFWGTTQISIPPNASATVGPKFQAGIAGTQLISITTHQHELGTGIRAWASAQAGDLSNQIADDIDWSNPSWRLITPSVGFDGTSGLSYECSWTNTTTSTVTFGESALAEMCFVGGYYYPSHGFDLCIDGSCRRTTVLDAGRD
jgi:hypothetical protein